MKESEVLKEVRKKLNMSQAEFADYFGIPKRTLQDWEYEKRRVPSYLLRLMIYKLRIEKMLCDIDYD